MNTEDTRNLFLAIALSILVMVAWQYFYAGPLYKQQHPAPTQTQPMNGASKPSEPTQEASSPPQTAAPAPISSAPGAPPVETVAQALAASPRVMIDTPSLGGSIDLKGGKLDDLVLKDYHETIDKKSPLIRLFSPSGAPDAYWAETGFVSAGGAVKTPNRETVWTADAKVLTPSQPVTLTWDNGEGLTFKRVISVDDKYMFTIVDSVTNAGGQSVSLRPYGLVLRHGMPQVAGYSVLHEGFEGVIGDQEHAPTYASIDKAAGKAEAYKGDGGWVGFTDKYWASALIPGQSEPIEARYSASGTVQPEDYQADFVGAEKTIAPGASYDNTTRLFAGAKEVSTIYDYQSKAKMKKIQPQIAALKEKYPDDKMKQQQEQMELFKREGVNPVAGCLPMVIQIPVFFALYKVIFITIEMRHAPFFGWIRDLSAPDPTNVFSLFGLIPWDPTALPVFGHFLALGIWPLIMGFSMFLQMKMNPEPADPVQKSMFAWMPVIFTFMLGTFPAGLVIYWTWNNTLTVIQQYYIMTKAGVKVELWDNLTKLFPKKSSPAKTPSV